MQKRSAVVEFIEKERQKGTSEESIRHQLLDGGWHMDIINRAMSDPIHPRQSTGADPEKLQQSRIKELVLNPFVLVGLFFVVLVLLALFI